MSNPTLSKFLEYLRPKYIGITIADQKLRALEPTKGIFLSEDVPETTGALLPGSIWKKPAAIKKLVKKVFQTAGVRFWTYQPVVIFSVPPNTSPADNKAVYNELMYAGSKSVYLLDDLILAALGSGVYQKDEGPVYQKKIYCLVQQDATYLGVVLAGGTFEVKTIAKGYDTLTRNDLQNELKNLIDNFPTEFPAQFQHRAVAKEMTQRLEEAWREKFEPKVSITAPERFKDHWGKTIDGYKLVYTTEGELAISKGIEQFFPALIVKRSPVGRRPVNPVQIYLLLFTVIAIIILFVLKR
jgi:hypothetical protein